MSQMIFLTSSTETGRNENLLNLYIFILQMPGCFSQFLMLLILLEVLIERKFYIPNDANQGYQQLNHGNH